MRKILWFAIVLAVFLTAAVGLAKCTGETSLQYSETDTIAVAAPDQPVDLAADDTPLDSIPKDAADQPVDPPADNTPPDDLSWHRNIDLPDGRRIVAQPAEYKTIEKQVIKTPASTTEKVTPAVTKEDTRRVVKTPAHTKEKRIPAVTKKIQKIELVTPAKVKEQVVPERTRKYTTLDPRTESRTENAITIAPETVKYTVDRPVFKTVEEEIVVQEETVELVRVPATYKTVTETVVVHPERVEYTPVPATYETVEEQILVHPARLVLQDRTGEILHDFRAKDELDAFLDDPDSPDFRLRPAYREKTETVVIVPETVEYIAIPPTFETLTETVVVQEASTELVTVPARYETKTETITVKPQYVEFEVIPAKTETVSKKIVTRKATSGQRAITETVNVQRIIEPASTRERVIPAVTKQIPRRVVAMPASTQERVIPAVTKQIPRRVVKTPANTVERAIPAVTREVTRLVPLETASVNLPSSDLFTWPVDSTVAEFNPPQTDIKVEIKHIYLKNADDSNPTLMCVYEKLVGALHGVADTECPIDVPIPTHKVYRIPNGFAILTKPERINEDAQPIVDENGDRIDLEAHPIESLGDYVALLFQKPKNRFRYLAFIVTARNTGIRDTGAAASVAELDETISSGSTGSVLPRELSRYLFTEDNYICEVWIYEFSKINTQVTDLQVDSSVVPAVPPLNEEDHVNGSPELKSIFEPEEG